MIFKKILLLFIFIILVSGIISTSESKDGRIRLVLHDKNGFFSLYYMTDPSELIYEPFFNVKDPSTNFMAVEVDGKIYRMGESRSFNTQISQVGANPAFIFESKFLKITEVFSLIKTPNSLAANGIKITIDVENTGKKESAVALRILFDTILGEGINKIPFVISGESISSEIIIDNNMNKKYWLTRDRKLSFMGSIELPDQAEGISPDFVHFANWKKLYDANWKALYYKGRSFNYTPYSTGDTAVCYYYEPRKLNQNESFQIVIYLSTEDKDGFLTATPAVIKPEIAVKNTVEDIIELAESDIDKYIDIYNEMILMRQYLETLDKFIAGEIILNDDDLSEIDLAVNDIKSRYNLN